MVFFGGVVGDTLGGLISDSILRRTGDLKHSRRDVVLVGLLGSLVFLLPVLFLHSLPAIVLCLGTAFFFAELVIGPMWSIPTDIAPRYCGIASSVMNIGSPLAAIISPVVFGFVVDRIGNWDLPFLGSIGLLLTGAVFTFKMHAEVPFEDPERATIEVALSQVEVATSRPTHRRNAPGPSDRILLLRDHGQHLVRTARSIGRFRSSVRFLKSSTAPAVIRGLGPRHRGEVIPADASWARRPGGGTTGAAPRPNGGLDRGEGQFP